MKTLLLAFLILVSSPSHAQSTGGKVGLGVAVGIPSVALTGKYFSSPPHAIDVGLAFNFGEHALFYGDYLRHFPNAFGRGSSVVPYLGAGGIVAIATGDTESDSGFRSKRAGGIGYAWRIPVGIEWRITERNLGLFIEAAPGASIFPQVTGTFQGFIGIRDYF